MELGMYYTRTNDGKLSLCKCGNLTPEEYIDTYKDTYNIKKASHNIIDLIEPMDLMFIDICPDDCGGIVVPRIAETLRELNDFKERFASGNCILKGVVTKEQIKANTYWVGE